MTHECSFLLSNSIFGNLEIIGGDAMTRDFGRVPLLNCRHKLRLIYLWESNPKSYIHFGLDTKVSFSAI